MSRWWGVTLLLLLAPAPPVEGCSRVTVQGATIAFGTYHPRDPHGVTTSSRVEVECSGESATELSYELHLETGESGRYDRRVLASGRSELVYNLFTESTLRSIWGDGTGSSFSLRGAFPPKGRGRLVEDHVIYGWIPPLQQVASGVYSDTLVIRIAF